MIGNITLDDPIVENLQISDGASETKGESTVDKGRDNLCERCQNLDIAGILGDYRTAKDSFEGYIVADLGSLVSMRESTCPLCQFFSSMALEKQTDDTCDCNLDQKLHTFPSFKSKDYQLRAMTVGYAYLGQEVGKGVRQSISGLQKQVMLGLAPKASSNDDWSIAHHCWYRIGMIGASLSADITSSSVGEKKRWNLRTRQILPEHISYDILTSWLDTCKDIHEEDCGSNASNKAPCAKVIDCKTGEIVKAPQSCQYIALSYVWGRTQELSPGPVKRETGNSTVLVMPDSLPLTVSDAMKVVRRLGFQYLWVDKYCINQEDPMEKMSQILCMDQIYENCTAVIVAAAGRDSSFGLPGVTTRARISQPTVTIEGVTLYSTLPNPVYTTRRSTWMTRGWTYQEAVFPKRRLYFTDHQVIFECNEALFTEVFDHPADIKVQQYQHDDSIFVATDVSDFNDPTMLRYAISSHIEAFSSRNVTYEVDALNALQGLFQRLQMMKSPVRQFYGLPILNAALSPDLLSSKKALDDGDVSDSVDELEVEYKPQHLAASGVLASALYWHHVPVSALEMRAIKRRTKFPSWTWLGWTKQVTWGADLPLDETNRIEIDVEDKEGRLWPWDTWHNAEAVMQKQESMSGRLRIRGWLVQAKITNVLSGGRRMFCVSRRGQRDVELYVSLGRALTPTLPLSGNKEDSKDLYQQLLDIKITWELLSLGPSEPLILLKDEGNGQFSRLGATRKTESDYRKSVAKKEGGSNQRKAEFWLI